MNELKNKRVGIKKQWYKYDVQTSRPAQLAFTSTSGRSLIIVASAKNHSGLFSTVPGPVVDSMVGTDELC